MRPLRTCSVICHGILCMGPKKETTKENIAWAPELLIGLLISAVLPSRPSICPACSTSPKCTAETQNLGTPSQQ